MVVVSFPVAELLDGLAGDGLAGLQLDVVGVLVGFHIDPSYGKRASPWARPCC